MTYDLLRRPKPFVVHAPKWHTGEVLVYTVDTPLRRGTYTFSAFNPERGLFVAAVKARGGEQCFEIPAGETSQNAQNPRLIRGGINMRLQPSIDFTDKETQDRLVRGISVRRFE